VIKDSAALRPAPPFHVGLGASLQTESHQGPQADPSKSLIKGGESDAGCSIHRDESKARSLVDTPERDRRRSVVAPVLPKRPCERSNPLGAAMTTTLTSPLRPSRHIEALLGLAPDEPSLKVASNLTPAPATELPGADWPPDHWD